TGNLLFGSGLTELLEEELFSFVRLQDAAHRQEPGRRILRREGDHPALKGGASGRGVGQTGTEPPEWPRCHARGRSERRDLVLSVPAEQLVRALARERHRDVLSGQAAKQDEAEA